MPLWLTDTYGGDVLYHSPAAAELLGYSWPVTEHYKSARSYASPEEREACTNELIEKGRLDGRVTRMKRSEEHTSELQSLMRNSYAVFCLTKKQNTTNPAK